MTQNQAADYIKSLLTQRGIKFESGIIQIGEQPCIVLETDSKSIAVDPGSGIWTGSEGKWNCISPTCTVSDALMAVDFLA